MARRPPPPRYLYRCPKCSTTIGTDVLPTSGATDPTAPVSHGCPFQMGRAVALVLVPQELTTP